MATGKLSAGFMSLLCSNVRPTSVEEENETFLIRVWKLLPSRRILKRSLADAF